MRGETGRKERREEREYSREEIIFEVHLTYLTYEITATQYILLSVGIYHGDPVAD